MPDLSWELFERQVAQCQMCGLCQNIHHKVPGQGDRHSPLMLMLVINFFLFLLGMVMDLTPNVLIFAPVLYPLILKAGIDPYYFGLIFILNLGIGVITPPVGTILYVVCGIGSIRFVELIQKLVPFIVTEIIVLITLTAFPKISIIPMKWLMGEL